MLQNVIINISIHLEGSLLVFPGELIIRSVAIPAVYPDHDYHGRIYFLVYRPITLGEGGGQGSLQAAGKFISGSLRYFPPRNYNLFALILYRNE